MNHELCESLNCADFRSLNCLHCKILLENLSIYKITICYSINNLNMIEEHFEKYHHKMQETRNNCFGSKKCSTILRQEKTLSTSAEI